VAACSSQQSGIPHSSPITARSTMSARVWLNCYFTRVQSQKTPVLPRVLLVVLCLGLFPNTGCKKKSSESEDKRNFSLVYEGELDKFRAALTAISKENAAKVCKRPLLRADTPIEGPADKDIIALLAEDGPMQACYSGLQDVESSIIFEEGILMAFQTKEGQARDLGDVSSLSSEIQASITALQESCDVFPALLAKAVSHEDACSPFLPGRKGQSLLISFMPVSKVALLKSRKLALAGRRLEAARLLLDTLRFGQDLSRGGTSLIEPMLAYAAHRNLRPELDRQLDSLCLEELKTIDGELALLEESHPHRFDYFEGDRNSMAIYMIWPGIEDQNWQPPGGDEEGRGSPPAREAGEDMHVDETAALGWVLMQESSSRLQELCPQSGPLRACVHAFDSYRSQLRKVDQPSISSLLKLAILPDDAARASLRAQVLDVLRAVAIPDYGKYYIRIEIMRLTLRAQRSKVQARIAALEKKPCTAPFPAAKTRPFPESL
jgi:hypothetical protein